MSLFGPALFNAKVKVMSGLGVVGITGVSVPATMAAANTDLQNSLFRKVSDIANKAYEKTKDKFGGFDEALSNEYSNRWTEGISEIEQRPEEIYNKYKDGKDWINNNRETVKNYAVEANYYGFSFGNVVKQALTHIPTILTDTAIDLLDPEAKTEQNLLSVGKMVTASESKELVNFLNGLKTALEKHPDMMGNISYNDAQGIIKILKNINYDKQSIDNFFKKVGDNSKTLETSYQCTTKLLIDLLVGKDQVTKIANDIDGLKTLIESISSTIEEMEEIGTEKLQEFKNKLDEIKKMENIGDPCPTPASSDTK